MNPLMLRTPHVFARPNSVDVSEIKNRAATISDPNDNLDTIASSQDDDLTLSNQAPEDWPLNADNITTIYPPILPPGSSAANEVEHWKIKDSPFHLDITLNPLHQFDELHLNETLSSGLLILSQKNPTAAADEKWATTTTALTSAPIILSLAQQRDSAQGGGVVESLEWRHLITLFGKPNGIWSYYTTTGRFCEIEFTVWDDGRAGAGGVCVAHGSVREG